MSVVSAASPDTAGPSGFATSAAALSESRGWLLALFVAAHVPLSIVLEASPAIATLHALGTLALGLTFLRDQHAERMVYVAAYATAMELCWRGAGAAVFWEYGKYSTSLLLVLAMIRFGKVGRVRKMPLMISFLMLPSILVLPNFNRQEIAFNLSGPVALGLASCFFTAVRFERAHLRNLLMVMMGPIVGLATLSARSSLNTDLTMIVAGSKATTGGIGPNQVSTMLGLGALLAFLLSFLWQERRWLRWACLATLVWLGVQCLLSFSRGGLWSALGAVLVAGAFLLRGRRSRGWLMVSAVLLSLLLNYAVFPLLNQVTAGRLQDRFSDTGLTGRDKIILADLDAFRERPGLGVGPGQSKYYHALTFGLASAHTEYSRLLAEHGSLGLAAIGIMFFMTLQRGLSRRPAQAKAVALSMTAWALLTMFHSAMRLSAVGFIFGLAGAWFSLAQPSEEAGSE